MRLLAALILLVATARAVSAASPLLLQNGQIVAGPGDRALPAAVVVDGGTIVFVGAVEEAKKSFPDAVTLDLAGGFVYPGFADSHGHLAGLGEFLELADLREAASEAECVTRLRRAATAVASGGWIKGRGWDQNLWPEKSFPDAHSLDAAFPGRPVVANRVDGHSIWASTAAMIAAGVSDRTPDPPGGKIVHRADGTPSGVFIDNARELIWKAEPAVAREDLRRQFAAAMKTCAEMGITEVGDASAYGDEDSAMGADRIDVLREMARSGDLPIRVHASIGWKSARSQSWFAKGKFREGLLSVDAVKVYADGALGSRGAALLADYSDDPGNRGVFVTSPEEIEKAAQACFRTGWQIWIHAIGDAANRAVLDAIEKADRAVHPGDARPRIEHAQVVAPADLPRFAKLGVIASIQPVFATSDHSWAEARLSRSRVGESYAWRSLGSAGARLCGGSDFPNDVLDPRAGLLAAVSRRTPAGEPPDGWRPEEDLPRRIALSLYTTGAAYAFFEERERGRIEPGYDADFTVFDRDISGGPEGDIMRARVLLTMVAGKVVYRFP